MKRKITAVLLCICLVSSFFTTASLADGTSEPMELLKAMGVLSGDTDGNMRPNDSVTRAEFAKMAVLLSPYKNQVALNVNISVFADCTSAHWASPYVKVASEKGIIQGFPEGTFRPDDTITYAQAVTVALKLLGYTDEDFGNTYPEPQLGMAQSLKLNEGISKTRDDVLSRSEVSQIFANTLSTKSKNSVADYITGLDYTLVKDCVLVATRAENPSVPSGKIYTSAGEYTISAGFDTTLIGHKGTALVTKEGRLVTLFKNTSSLENCAVYGASSSLVTTYNKNKISTLNCDDATPCFYNLQMGTFSSVRSFLSTGDILTIGKAKDGSIDYIIVGNNDFDGPHTIDDTSSLPSHIPDTGVSFVKNGEPSALSEIKPNDIIYYSASLSTVFVYNKKVSGTYSQAIPNTASPESIVVANTSYSIESPLAFSKLCSLSGLDIGEHIVLLLGKDGKVADVLTNEVILTDTDIYPKPTQGSTLSKEYALLEALDAIDIGSDNRDNPDTTVTRGEFAKMAVMSSVHRNKVALGTKLSIFPDCTASYWATPYVKVAVENGLMSAFASGRFMPDDPITYAYLLDTSLKLLGYTSSDMPDFPQSQVSIARNLGIIESTQFDPFEAVSKKDAVTIIYNTLCAYQKSGSQKAIDAMGYKYYDDCVMIATSNENSSVSYGKVKTSSGTFTIEPENFDYSSVGKSGQLLTLSDKVIMFNENEVSYIESVVHSSLSGGLALMSDDGIKSVLIPKNLVTYANAEKTSFEKIKDSIAMGDTVTLCYDEEGRCEYLFVNTNSLFGPYICMGDNWYQTVDGATSSTKLIKDGRETDKLSLYDVIYYSPSLDTVFAYDDKVTGIFEDASPTKTAPDSVTVSGVSYTLSGSGVIDAGINYGDNITLCLGRDGGAVFGYTSKDRSLAGYLIATGIKEFKNSNDETYTSVYASFVLPDGSRIDCATDSDYKAWINKVVGITFENGKAKITGLSSGKLAYGKVDSEKLTIGQSMVSSDVKILDVGYQGDSYPAIYTTVYLPRLDGVALSEKNILYAKTEDGKISELILNNVTGDAFSYGVVLSARTSQAGFNTSGSYSVDINGTTYTYSGGAVSNIKKGSVVRTALSGNRIQHLFRLQPQSVNIESCDFTSITLSNGKRYILSEDVTVYKLTANTTYTLLPISELYENLDTYSYNTIYTDSSVLSGGRVRVIVLQ